MSLSADIEKAFLKSMGNPEDRGNIPTLSKDISSAIIKFLQDQEFNITKMKAILEIEELTTNSPLPGDVLNTVTVSTSTTNIAGAPTTVGGITNGTGFGQGTGTVTNGRKGVQLPPLKLKNTHGSQGGLMTSKGHAYIGPNPVNSSEPNVNISAVKLLKVVGK
jgi:hypothetical protein